MGFSYLMVSDLPVSSNCNILLAGKTGDMVVAECTGTVKKPREPVAMNKDSKVICTTNCFVSDDMKQFENEKLKHIDLLKGIILLSMHLKIIV